MEPLFKVVKDLGKDVEGDFVAVEKKKKYIKFDTGLHTSIIKMGKEIVRDLDFEDSSLIDEMFGNMNVEQGYILCNEGILNDVCIAFFLTKHKPTPTFAKATIKGTNQIQSITGFFLPIYNSKNLKYDIVPHLHIVFTNIGTRRIFSGHLVDAPAGKLKIKIVPLTGKSLKRDVDPNTGLMYLRTYPIEDFSPKSGDTILFACGPKENFPLKLFKHISKFKVKRADIIFAVGTLTSACIIDSNNSNYGIMVRPKEGLELAQTQGEILFKDYSNEYKINVHLTDMYGNQYKGLLVHGIVKELVEGLLKVEV
ncbi:MAG: hypothetical protein N3F64_07030 [Nitrososphaeria archaeon]|nr:hypothetical protein [Nitrososphaeria archaeon]